MKTLIQKDFFVCLFILPWAVAYLFFLYYSCIFQKILLLLSIILFQRCTVDFFQAFLQVRCSKCFIIFVFYFRTTPSLSRFSLKTSSALSRLEQLLCITWNTPVNIFHTDTGIFLHKHFVLDVLFVSCSISQLLFFFWCVLDYPLFVIHMCAFEFFFLIIVPFISIKLHICFRKK